MSETLLDPRVFAVSVQAEGPGRPIAIKDNIDLTGFVTSAGCRALAERNLPATRDAACLAGIRAAVDRGDVRIVGRTTLDELAQGATGINEWTGTAPNPLDPSLIPGGSSSGSAVAVASGIVEIGIGTDTGGSVRIPSACCGVAGLKTTRGRVSLDGIHPLSPTLDTVGPIARTIEDLTSGMELLEPGFRRRELTELPAVGRVRLGLADPDIEADIDRALCLVGAHTTDVELADWHQAHVEALTILMSESWRANRVLLDEHSDGLSAARRADLTAGSSIQQTTVDAAHDFRERWTDTLHRMLETTPLLCLPTIGTPPPALDDADAIDWGRFSLTMPFNLAGLPALAMPLRSRRPIPTSVQLVAAPGQEEMLLGAAALIEASWLSAR